MKARNKLLVISAVLCMILIGFAIRQCSTIKRVKSELSIERDLSNRLTSDYLALVEAKTQIDTFYRYSDTLYIKKRVVEKETDTLYIKEGKAYSLFKDTFQTEDLTLTSYITGVDVDSINYEYSVRERVIINNTITTVHDTVPQSPKRHLYLLADVGLPSYSAGLQLQGKKRWGYIVRYTWYRDSQSISAGLSYRLF